MAEALGILLCDDLIFSSRITGTAAALGLKLRTAKTVENLTQILAQSSPRCVILDLHTAGLEIDAFARAMAERHPKPVLVGYGSHVDTVTLRRAREAGLDVVWPRSKFVDELAAALPVWLGPNESSP